MTVKLRSQAEGEKKCPAADVVRNAKRTQEETRKKAEGCKDKASGTKKEQVRDVTSQGPTRPTHYIFYIKWSKESCAKEALVRQKEDGNRRTEPPVIKNTATRRDGSEKGEKSAQSLERK